MLYHRDVQTGDHLVTHNGQERRFATRAAALAAVHDLRTDPAERDASAD